MSDHAKTAALILAKAPKGEDDGHEKEVALQQCMEDLHRAVTSETPSYRAMASAFRSAFDVLESEPHEEDGE